MIYDAYVYISVHEGVLFLYETTEIRVYTERRSPSKILIERVI